MLVFDSQRGVMKATLNTQYEISNFEDIQIGIYKFSNDFNFKNFGWPGDLIVVSNLDGLSPFLSKIEEFLLKQEEYVRKTLKKFPRTILGVFNELLFPNS
jgi:hypothetical protein